MPRARTALVCPTISPHLLVQRSSSFTSGAFLAKYRFCLCTPVALQASSSTSSVSLSSFRSEVSSSHKPCTIVHRLSLQYIFDSLWIFHIFGLSSDFLRSSSVGAFLACSMVCLLASPSGDMPSLLSHEIFSGKLT